MPWHIESRGDEFCVIKDDDGENEGCHPTREEAERQMRALYSNEDAAPRRYRVAFLAGEGVRTGDGRVYETLDFRAPPLDLFAQFGGQHSDVQTSDIVGQIVDIGKGADGVLWAEIEVDPAEPDAERAIRHIEHGGQGISADFVIDSSTAVFVEDDGTVRIAAATIGGATLVSLPAYTEAIVDPSPIGLKQVVLPAALVASAAVAPVPSLLASAGYALTAGAAVDLADWQLDPAHFVRPTLSADANYINVEDDGRVWGWIAATERCHQSFAPGTCVLASDQSPDLSDFLRNHLPIGDQRVPVGFLTMDQPHADGTAGARAAMAHYDDTRAIAAIVTAGIVPEGEHSAGSVWFSGSVSPRLDAWQRTVLAAGQASGDWRADAGQPRTLRAALVVPVPGFLRQRDPVYASGNVSIGHVTVNGVPLDEWNANGNLVASGGTGCGCGGERGCTCTSTHPAPLTAAQQAALARVADERLDADLRTLDADMALVDLPAEL